MELRHVSTGARHIHIATPDDNNLFSVLFLTVPTDSTGVAHILEHVVLAGSQRFPIRDPFFSLSGSSLATFLNALTAADWTQYLFSTRNPREFRNLAEVYLDAAFFPLLREDSFRQEGHRLEFEDPEDPRSPLRFKGVVFNEMKATWSSAGRAMGDALRRSLFWGTTYANVSGGDPSRIPDLGYDQLVAFHRRHYHPANARFFTYGDRPLEESLELIADRVLSRFGPAAGDPPAIGQIERRTAPAGWTERYPLGPGDDPATAGQALVAWASVPAASTFESEAMGVLGDILLANSASPLRKRLIDSGLGTALADGTGFHDSFQETAFAAGLKGIDPARGGAVHELVLQSLREIAEAGLDPSQVEAALHQYELSRRERSNVPTSQAMRALFTVLPAYLYGGDPLAALDVDRLTSSMRDGFAAGLGERLIRDLLANPHRADIRLEPDADLLAERQRAEDERLAAILASIDEAGERHIVEGARRLRSLQEAPEDVTVLPLLTPADVTIRQEDAPSVRTDVERSAITFFPQPTGGFTYAAVDADLSRLAARESDLLGVLTYVLPRVGIAGVTHEAMARRIAASTGGVDAGVRLLALREGGATALFTIAGKALSRNAAELIEIAGDLLAGAEFAPERTLQLLQERAAQLRSRLSNGARDMAVIRARALLRPDGRLLDHVAGIEHFRTVLGTAVPAEAEAAIERLDRLRRDIAAAPLEVSVTSDPDDGEDVIAAAGSLVRRLRSSEAPSPGVAGPAPVGRRQAFIAPMAVAANVLVLPAPAYGDADSAVMPVLARYLATTYLHPEIREKGGAYGAIASVDARAGLLTLMSFADPHVERTHSIWRDAASALLRSGIDHVELDKAKIGAAAGLDPLESPDTRGRKTLLDLRSGFPAEVRRQFGERLLRTTADDLLRCAEAHLRFETGSLVSIGGEAALTATASAFDSVEPLAG